ncbi:MAG: class A beta-lactamase-related serine hydrolase [Gemmatimonadota bacterium]|nr:class A beta-lactamase-related serine hydrolase [Gemmatimonadota bacterium]
MIVHLLLAAQLAAAGDSGLAAAIDRRVAATDNAQVAVAFLDLGSGASYFRNADTVFHAASTMKVPVLVEAFYAAREKRISLEQQLLLINQFASIVDGTPYALDAGVDGDSALYGLVGQRVPIRDLARRMITRSSNLATNTMVAVLGADQINVTARKLGVTRSLVLRGVEDQKAFDRGMINTMTARDLATLFAALERGQVAGEADTRDMLDILLAQEFNEKIPAGLPPGTRVAHKTGEITAVSHDGGIVYPPGRSPYVIVVLTRGVRNGQISSALIADISRIVHAHVTGAP